MVKRTIVICDDRDASRAKWQAALTNIPEVEAAFEVNMLADLVETIQLLESRRGAAKKTADAEYQAERIDSADILVIDYDLREALAGATGERLSYLARCYSSCGVIVALNQFEPFPTFDLTLRGHPESFADLNLHDSMLSNRGLWVGPTFEEFRPWSWPLLPRAAADFIARVDDVTRNAEKGVLETLGLEVERASLLSRPIASFLGGTELAETVTFDDFVTKSGHGLRGADQAGPSARARIAAARVSKWLERFVLPGQDILTDAPHLVSRYPSLLRRGTSAGDWSATAAIASAAGEATDLNLDTEKIKGHSYAKRHWVSRPVWYWSEVSASEEIVEVADPWSAVEQRYAFAEDTSRFHEFADVKPFQPAGPTTFIRRYVSRKRPPGSPRGLRYLPLDQFADRE